jgi:hypothetical protein
VRSGNPNKLVVGLDDLSAEIPLSGGADWQRVRLLPTDFHKADGSSILDWQGLRELRLGAKETLRINGNGNGKTLDLGADWQGAPPEFRNLRWVAGTQ